MSHWNYRIVRSIEDDSLFVAECYYNDGGEPRSITNPVTFVGKDLNALRFGLKEALKALEKPILEEADFG